MGGGRGRGEAKLYNGERAYSSINPSILSGLHSLMGKFLNNIATLSFWIIAIENFKKISHISIYAVSNSI
jgi:hypothetical protein